MAKKEIENKRCMDCIFLIQGISSIRIYSCMKIRGRFDYNECEFVEDRMRVMPSRKACEFYEGDF